MSVHAVWQNTVPKAAQPRGLVLRFFAAALGTVTVVYLLRSWLGQERVVQATTGVSHQARNETLGFGKAFYISLAHRSDRQDAMELLASFTDVKLTLVAGVNGSEISERAIPQDASSLRPAQLGCWRGHADTWRRILDENIETALVLEDDVDWDVNVKDVFQELSHQMRKGKVRDSPQTAHEFSTAPYGLDWDLLYVGNCYDITDHDKIRKHHTYKDPNAPNRAEMGGAYVSELEGWGLKVDDSTRKRILAPSWYPVCTLGYAVTRRGAQRLLYNIGQKGFSAPIDLVMVEMVQKGILRSYTIVPPLLTTWKSGSTRDSDIDDLKKLKEEKEKEGKELDRGSSNLRASARLRMEEVLGKPLVA